MQNTANHTLHLDLSPAVFDLSCHLVQMGREESVRLMTLRNSSLLQSNLNARRDFTHDHHTISPSFFFKLPLMEFTTINETQLSEEGQLSELQVGYMFSRSSGLKTDRISVVRVCHQGKNQGPGIHFS